MAGREPAILCPLLIALCIIEKLCLQEQTHQGDIPGEGLDSASPLLLTVEFQGLEELLERGTCS